MANDDPDTDDGEADDIRDRVSDVIRRALRDSHTDDLNASLRSRRLFLDTGLTDGPNDDDPDRRRLEELLDNDDDITEIEEKERGNAFSRIYF